jgi:hypothetical protein
MGKGMPDETRVNSFNEMQRSVTDYLLRHPEAKDTLEGIRQWWMPDDQVEPRTDELQLVLDELVSRGWLVELELPASPKLYGLNKQSLNQIVQV